MEDVLQEEKVGDVLGICGSIEHVKARSDFGNARWQGGGLNKVLEALRDLGQGKAKAAVLRGDSRIGESAEEIGHNDKDARNGDVACVDHQIGVYVEKDGADFKPGLGLEGAGCEAKRRQDDAEAEFFHIFCDLMNTNNKCSSFERMHPHPLCAGWSAATPCPRVNSWISARMNGQPGGG